MLLIIHNLFKSNLEWKFKVKASVVSVGKVTGTMAITVDL